MSELDTKIFEEKMGKTVAGFERDLETIRAGRANPNVLSRITVDNYGAPAPISQVANITVPEARLLQIAPWDPNMLKAIERAVMASDLGINPNNDGKVIRLVFPELTEDRRKDLVKEVKKRSENAKVAIRNVRREAVDAMEKAEKKGDITEDDLKKDKSDIQKFTDKKIEEVDKIVEKKTKEIMTV
ncbi:MAG: ribosome recycling factor [Clostridiales bacterium]|jgi:ribosome recycling factor|nr:ribosome recycling factor [Clostridiales bacterium]